MAYRSGWASKPNQERVLGIRIRRTGFEWALRNASVNTSGQEGIRESSVRIQWDPERDVTLERLEERSIQIGLSGEAAREICGGLGGGVCGCDCVAVVGGWVGW